MEGLRGGDGWRTRRLHIATGARAFSFYVTILNKLAEETFRSLRTQEMFDEF